MTYKSPEELKDCLPDPVWTVQQLDRYIIGQDAAKKTLAIMMLNRALNMLKAENKIDSSIAIPKCNALLVGPSGTGKTALMRALGKIFDIPITVYDVTAVTANGYVGADVEDILHAHINNQYDHWYNNIDTLFTSPLPNHDLNQKAKDEILKFLITHGIIYLDEVDKICANETDGVDVTGDSVQNSLLKFLEGGRVDINNGRSSGLKNKAGYSSIDTTDMFFVAGGAFSGIGDIIQTRLEAKTSIGFTSSIAAKTTEAKNNVLKHITTEDIVNYGFKKEFIGRIPLITSLDELTVDALVRIISEPVDSVLSQYTQVFKVLGKTLTVEEAAFKVLAEHALDLKMGARALKHVFNNLFMQNLYNVFADTDSKVTITSDIVKERLNATTKPV